MSSTRVFVAVGLIVGILVLGLWLQPRVGKVLAPVPVAAWVAVETENSGIAEFGAHRIEAGTPFRLYAVLEALDRGGERVFYTTAPALKIDGSTVPADRLLTWERPLKAQILWFTVEGRTPFLRVPADADLSRLSFEAFFHPEWSTQWSVDGVIETRFREQFGETDSIQVPFGTQRFQVWIELVPQGSGLPESRFKSAGAEDLPGAGAAVTTVSAFLPSAPVASEVFGLTQVEPAEGASEGLLEILADGLAERLYYSRIQLLREILGPTSSAAERISLAAETPWPEQVKAGDVVQVGSRWVVLYRDQGTVGRLDADDLCLDFVQGSEVRRLGDVFSGDGDVDWVSVGE